MDGSGDAGLSFSSTPIQTVRSDSGSLSIAVYAQQGRSPARGVNAFRYMITDSGGAPVNGIQVTVLPFMPAMNHGSSVMPMVSGEGAGAYVVSNVVFAMPGRWELNCTFTGPVTDAAKLSFDIP